MQPDKVTTWEEYSARQAARETGEEFGGQPVKQTRARKRRTGEAKEASLAGLLLQAIQLAGTRRGRLSQAESIREQTLLEVLTATIRRAQ